MKISVAMAVYNGEKYLREQVDSILSQIGEDAQLVISIDPSEDGTEAAADSCVRADSRIKKVYGQGQGLIRNFENAIMHCDGDIIFLSDQDDVWIAGKVQKCMDCFADAGVMAVVHDAYVCGERTDEILLPSFFEYKHCRTGIFNNIVRNSCMGCCMAFRRELLKWVLPFPQNIPMHDQWIGLMAQIHGEVVFLDDRLVRYRRHGGNMSRMRHAGIGRMLVWRIQLIVNLIKRNFIV